MFGGISRSADSSLDTDDLLEIRERFKECNPSYMRILESYVKKLSESRKEDKKRIIGLERELSNCLQEIDFLQDQLSMRNSSLNCPGTQVCRCQSKFVNTENLVEETRSLREQIKMSESERSLLMQEIEDKEVVMRCSASRIENLEESISSMSLEYQCEIESMKLDLITLEQNLLETKKLLEEKNRENSRMNGLIQDLELQNQDVYKVIESLEKENKDLKEKMRRSDMCTKVFVRDMEEQFHELGKTDVNSSSKLQKDLRPAIFKLSILIAADADLRNKIVEMSHQVEDYELLVRRLKEELRDERLKSKEEAEELAQEMAELRYQLTAMLDEECKRRASFEHVSLQRIAELEDQIAKEREKSNSAQALVVRNQ